MNTSLAMTKQKIIKRVIIMTASRRPSMLAKITSYISAKDICLQHHQHWCMLNQQKCKIAKAQKYVQVY